MGLSPIPTTNVRFILLLLLLETMKVELKQIIDELTDAINLPNGQKVSALVDNEKIVGWTIVNVHEDGTIVPISDKNFNNIKELISEYKIF